MTEWKETEVCRILGLNRAELRALREQAAEGLHWRRMPRNGNKDMWPVMWTEAGIGFLKEKAKVEDEVVEELKGQEAKPSETYGIVKGKVNVLVRDSKNFVVGMKVPLRSDGQRWVAAKHPRFGGRW
jgi:hypothetical protein